jgi:hypothetical protein
MQPITYAVATIVWFFILYVVIKHGVSAGVQHAAYKEERKRRYGN